MYSCESTSFDSKQVRESRRDCLDGILAASRPKVGGRARSRRERAESERKHIKRRRLIKEGGQKQESGGPEREGGEVGGRVSGVNALSSAANRAGLPAASACAVCALAPE